MASRLTNDIRGFMSGRLTAIERSTRNGKTAWICQCKCGNMCTVIQNNLVSGDTKSCGCLYRETRKQVSRTHGYARTRTYRIWCGIVQRCTNPRNKDYGAYQGKLCDKWREFAEFLKDMGPCPSDLLTLDRIANDGNYEPGNCRWATRKEQTHNSATPVLITHSGKTMCIAEWARFFGVKPQMLVQRRWRGTDIFAGLEKVCA